MAANRAAGNPRSISFSSASLGSCSLLASIVYNAIYFFDRSPSPQINPLPPRLNSEAVPVGNPCQRGPIGRRIAEKFFRWRSVISQLPSITFRESAFQIGRGDAVTVKADELASSTFAWHVHSNWREIKLIRISSKPGRLKYTINAKLFPRQGPRVSMRPFCR